jgi:hypothetical protein
MSGEYFTGNEGNRNKYGNLLPGLLITRSVLQQAVTIGATATAIPTTALSARHSLLIFNNASNPVFLGSASVSTANGYPLYPRGQLLVQIEDGVTLYGISSAGGDEIRCMEGA